MIAYPHCTARLLIFLLLAPGALVAQTNTPSRANQLVMIQGSVEVMKVGSAQWSPASRDQVLQPGDRVRTGERSRAEIFFSSGQTIQKGEFSEVEIPPSNNPTFARGIFKVFNREPQRGSDFRLPNTATAAIRGTDFLVRVDENGNSEITVLDGEVLLKNPQGELLLGRNERGVAEQGRPPTKMVGLPESEEESRAWRQSFAAALSRYQRKAFVEAEEGFRKTLELRPTDGPSKFYLERIQQLKTAALPSDWFGEIDLREK